MSKGKTERHHLVIPLYAQNNTFTIDIATLIRISTNGNKMVLNINNLSKVINIYVYGV